LSALGKFYGKEEKNAKTAYICRHGLEGKVIMVYSNTFTVIPASVSIIAILIGLLLPAVR